MLAYLTAKNLYQIGKVVVNRSSAHIIAQKRVKPCCRGDGISFQGRSFLTHAYFALTILNGFDFMALLFMGRQTPTCKLAIRSEYLSGVKPLSAFGATKNPISVRNNIPLLTPVVHLFSHRDKVVSLEWIYRRFVDSKGGIEVKPRHDQGITLLWSDRNESEDAGSRVSASR